MASESTRVVIGDIRKEHQREKGRFHECNRVVGDAYRRIGKGGERVTFSIKVRVAASNGRGRATVVTVNTPPEIPTEARTCFERHFPKEFVSAHDFVGTVDYDMCIYVLPKPLEDST